MKTPDLINGAFELFGSAAVWMNVQKLLADKKVRGVRWQLSVFFLTWSAWNMYYYPHLGQWLSLAGGLALLAANAVWVTLAIYYTRKERAFDTEWRH